MENRRGQAAKDVFKVQTLGLLPALNVSQSLGKFKSGILIQHFIKQRGQIQVWTHLGTCQGCLRLGFCSVPFSEAESC